MTPSMAVTPPWTQLKSRGAASFPKYGVLPGWRVTTAIFQIYTPPLGYTLHTTQQRSSVPCGGMLQTRHAQIPSPPPERTTRTQQLHPLSPRLFTGTKRPSHRLCAACLTYSALVSELGRTRHRCGTRGSRTSLSCRAIVLAYWCDKRALATLRCTILLGGDGSPLPSTCSQYYGGETLRHLPSAATCLAYDS